MIPPIMPVMHVSCFKYNAILSNGLINREDAGAWTIKITDGDTKTHSELAATKGAGHHRIF